jgi:hypothetical protein
MARTLKMYVERSGWMTSPPLEVPLPGERDLQLSIAAIPSLGYGID